MPSSGSIPLGHGPPARVEVLHDGGRTTVVVHASVRPIVKAGLAAWLAAWAIGELVSLRLLLAGAGSLLPFFQAFLHFFLAGWTAMGLFVGHSLLWCLEGTEELSTDGFELTFRRQVRGLGRTRRFPLANVRGPIIRYDGWVTSASQVPPEALVRVSFDTRWHTYRIGASLRHEDAQRVLSALGRAGPGRPQESRRRQRGGVDPFGEP